MSSSYSPVCSNTDGPAYLLAVDLAFGTKIDYAC